jgi:hypothetical protein
MSHPEDSGGTTNRQSATKQLQKPKELSSLRSPFLKCTFNNEAFEFYSRKIAAMAARRARFDGLEDKLLWYEALPYLGLSRADERRLLADPAVQGLAPAEAEPIALGRARAHELDAAGRKSDALVEITRAYNAAVKLYDAGDSGN